MSDLIEAILRTIFSVFLLLLSTHVIGKQAISRLTYTHYFVSITLGSIAGNLAFDTKLNAFNLAVSFVLFSALAVLLSYLALKSRTLKKWIIGEPVILIDKGKILEKNLSKINMSLEVLNESLRRKDIFDINEVECAILEMDGGLSVLKKPMYLPVTRKDLSLKTSNSSFPAELIVDGEIIVENLTNRNLTMEWLEKELHKRKLKQKDVNYMVLGSNNQLYIDLYEDHINK
ncbi:DUF421 domain-containing protein [Thermoflavimicrobium dichotomicum]|uniref:Uncharacterized membrane protein YcaP, DUF421 family n=1 Tax=Thermoflavimicrobium dichotomicum TaxID=46223 RepID=A0A1I3Q7V0_9BACL|nr:DUF421 domain-containing protein [Thermoflavimicrobium dichotomicum]SFJ29487.1 Uncharacterized membrane protein YcaP, DUF421 family [Thermoflavimicrobium dichotomicum]